MKSTILALAALSTLVIALPSGGGNAPQTYGGGKATSSTQGGGYQTSTTKQCTPTTIYSTSVAYTSGPVVSTSTSKSEYTSLVKVTETKTKEVVSTVVNTGVSTVETRVPVVVTTSKPVVYTSWKQEVETSYVETKTVIPIAETTTTLVPSLYEVCKTSTVVSTKEVPCPYTTYTKQTYSTVVPVSTSTCGNGGYGWRM